MFERTLESTILPADSRNASALTAAVIAHGVILVAAIVVSALTIPPVSPPPLRPIFWITTPRPEPGPRQQALPRPPSPPKGVPNPGPATATPRPSAPPLTPPASAPSEPPRGSPTDPGATGGAGPVGLPTGTDDGVPGGTGTGPASSGPDGSDDPVFVGPGVTEPVLVIKVEPTYPAIARVARISGKVVLQAVIGLDGSVESAEILSSTSPLFEGEALAAVRRWRYRPATMNGRPVRAYFRVMVDFVLR